MGHAFVWVFRGRRRRTITMTWETHIKFSSMCVSYLNTGGTQGKWKREGKDDDDDDDGGTWLRCRELSRDNMDNKTHLMVLKVLKIEPLFTHKKWMKSCKAIYFGFISPLSSYSSSSSTFARSMKTALPTLCAPFSLLGALKFLESLFCLSRLFIPFIQSTILFRSNQTVNKKPIGSIQFCVPSMKFEIAQLLVRSTPKNQTFLGHTKSSRVGNPLLCHSQPKKN